MIDALIVSNAILWIVVLALAALVVALLRQIGVLHERVSPAGALIGAETPAVGDATSTSTLVDLRGRAVSVGGRDPSGQTTLIFFLSPTCPVCRTLLPVLRAMRASEGGRLRLVFASDGPPEEHAAYVRENGLEDEAYVLSSALGLAFKVGRLPHAVMLDSDGIVRARGLVNTREHLESLFEARARGVASLQEYLEQRRAGERA